MASGRTPAPPRSHPAGARFPARWVESLTELVADVPDGCRLGVSGFHFTRAPVASVRHLIDRGVRDLTFVSWGGGVALELLLEADVIARVELCFSSLDMFGLAPRFRAAVEDGRVELHEWTALSLISGFRARAENLAWEVLQTPDGSNFADDVLPVETGAAVPMSRVEPIAVDVFLLHAQRADEQGNVEICGARGTDLSMAFAADRVLVTVEERVPVGQLERPRSFILPRSHVTALAEASGGAHPTSCLPYYAVDLRVAGALVEPGASAMGRPTPQQLGPARRLAEVGSDRLRTGLRHHRASTDLDQPWTIDELMTVMLARTVDDDSICSFGSAAPLPATAYLLAKASHAPRALLMSHNGGYVDIAARPMTLCYAEQLDFDSAVAHTGGDETYHWYYQAGRVTHEVVGSAQIDGRAATNNRWITRDDGSFIRLPGQGGMADVANLHQSFVIYVPRHSPRVLVETVETISACRAWVEAEQRTAWGFAAGPVRVLTNLCVFELDPRRRRLELVGLHPDVEVSDVEAATGFTVETAPRLDRSRPPDAEELRLLRTVVDPLGIRRLDFVPARDRRALLDEIMRNEELVGRSLDQLPQEQP